MDRLEMLNMIDGMFGRKSEFGYITVETPDEEVRKIFNEQMGMDTYLTGEMV